MTYPAQYRFPPLLKETTTPAGTPAVALLVDPSTDVGKYITSELTAAGKNPNDPQALTEFVTTHDGKAKTATGLAFVAAAVALLAWWGQKKGNLPASLNFVKNKMVFYGIAAVAVFFVYRAYTTNQKNNAVKQALASFIQITAQAQTRAPGTIPS